jgi:hypothetical protein
LCVGFDLQKKKLNELVVQILVFVLSLDLGDFPKVNSTFLTSQSACDVSGQGTSFSMFDGAWVCADVFSPFLANPVKVSTNGVRC